MGGGGSKNINQMVNEGWKNRKKWRDILFKYTYK